jgi:excisionase family DNA binding protein
MTLIEDTELLTTAEVARLLRVRSRTVRRWIAAGALPAVRVGAHYRIPVDALDTQLVTRPHNVPPRQSTTNRKAA